MVMNSFFLPLVHIFEAGKNISRFSSFLNRVKSHSNELLVFKDGWYTDLSVVFSVRFSHFCEVFGNF